MIIIPVDYLIVEETHGSLEGDPLTQLVELESEADRQWCADLSIELNRDQYITQFVDTHFGEPS